MKKFDIITSIIQTIFAFLIWTLGLVDTLINFKMATKWDGLFIMIATIIFTQSIDILVKELKESNT